MAASGSLTIQGTITGLLTGTKTIGPITLADTNASPSTTEIVLASGANTITVPSATTCSGVLIVFAAASTTTKTIKGVGGDTGIRVSPNGPCFLSFDSASVPATFVINSSAADTSNVTEILFI